MSVVPPRRTLEMISSASLCQTKGLGSSFQCSVQISIASIRFGTDVKTLSGARPLCDGPPAGCERFRRRSRRSRRSRWPPCTQPQACSALAREPGASRFASSCNVETQPGCQTQIVCATELGGLLQDDACALVSEGETVDWDAADTQSSNIAVCLGWQMPMEYRL